VIHLGDCVEVMAGLPADSIDAVVTDPPYGLEFMGKEWDRFRVDPRSARWASRSGEAGGFSEATYRDGRHATLPSYTKRRMTSVCRTCGKRDAFQNPHACGEAADWRVIPVDVVNVELRAYQEWCRLWALEALRVAKPGAHLLAFGGTRTYHRLAAGIEDAGWEIRDTLVWAYASGFPKNLDVSKAIDKAAGAQREVVGERLLPDARASNLGFRALSSETGSSPPPAIYQDTAPATPEAVAWQGWGTALKPAWEPIVLARKPLIGSVARNVLEHGTGALNIDATRIPADGETWEGGPAVDAGGVAYGGALNEERSDSHPLGRWPANVLLTDPLFDGDTDGVVGGGETGFSQGSSMGDLGRHGIYGEAAGFDEPRPVGFLDSGTYSRFFLIPKAPRSDREPVLRGSLGADTSGVGALRDGGRPSEPRENTHPTVKPVELMRHLVRLVTPARGTVLDPFLGSGSTAIAAEMEGFPWMGIEREPEYVRIAEARLNGTQRGLGLDVPAPAPRVPRTHPDLSKHQPKQRAPSDSYSGGWAGWPPAEDVA
jgi:DNA modification methylase